MDGCELNGVALFGFAGIINNKRVMNFMVEFPGGGKSVRCRALYMFKDFVN